VIQREESLSKSCVRLGYVALSLVVFFIIFHTPDSHWRAKFTAFRVPALEYPGGDARNIQLTAICHKGDSNFYKPTPCYQAAEIVRSRYPDAVVPPFNYPTLWARIYRLFADSSEAFFVKFWQANSASLILMVSILALKYNALLFPVIAFSPITLLAIERGNTDAVLLLLVFAPLMLPSRAIQAFFIGFAGALKIYPVFALAGLALTVSSRRAIKSLLLGLLIASPLLAQSFSELGYIHGNTPRAFDFSYGLTSFFQHPALANKGFRAAAALLIYCLATGCILFMMLRNRQQTLTVSRHLNGMLETDRTILVVSLMIFVLSFVTFVNFAYRFVFTIPAIFLLSRWISSFGFIVFAALLFSFVAPFFPSGWRIFNFACYVAFIPCTYILLVALINSPIWREIVQKLNPPSSLSTDSAPV
jgi:hypothetical protein